MRSKLLIVTLSAGALIVVGCGSDTPTKTTPSKTVPRVTSDSDVDFEASGTGRALITYGSSSTGIKQETVILPWSTFQVAKPTDGITLRVNSETTGPVQCEITVNGEVRVTNQAQGTSAIAACTTHG
jgi:hypothetical protein